MTDRRPEGTAYTGAEGTPPPIPADMPDQQVQEGEDALDVTPPPWAEQPEDTDADPDEAGAGARAARNAGVHPEHPTPDESTG
ncbi:hypothetical protein OG233_09360 [Streptomyces sp. NBC_01218]|uniref:hypothetical protein n=1 Tax=unclassified Streptomyces TaxID=2593676 RepID=UPI0023B900B8|nr:MULTISPECIES: hypothetical protein [unclassified Streptomyces]WEH39679.1 hypothetical protein PZB77_09190 [Streptomyces sp. AM 2-1-1]WSQ51369.1 hypothetical protein OG233_09360 [Streptomyces sp. NBC_01218]